MYWYPSGGFVFSANDSNDEMTFGVKFNPNGSYYATYYRHELVIWNSTTRENITNLDIRARILNFDWSPSGDNIAMLTLNWSSGNWTNYELLVYDIATGEFRFHYVGDYSVVFLGDIEYNPNGSMIAVSYKNNTIVYNSTNYETVWNYTSPYDRYGDGYLL